MTYPAGAATIKASQRTAAPMSTPVRRFSASPRSATRQRGRTDVNQKLLAAMETLLARGETFSSVTVERLAEAAGISRATFYLHYRDKAELVRHLVEQVRSEIVAAAGRWFEDASLTTRADIKQTLRGIIGVYRTHHVILSAMVQMAPADVEVAKLSRRMVDELCAESRRAVGQLAAAGRGNPKASERVADLLTMAIHHCSIAHPELLSGRKFEELIETWTHISWSAMASE
jgi:TetR/AcrR family transcriptional regulator, ethionamide resistance regulator